MIVLKAIFVRQIQAGSPPFMQWNQPIEIYRIYSRSVYSLVLKILFLSLSLLQRYRLKRLICHGQIWKLCFHNLRSKHDSPHGVGFFCAICWLHPEALLWRAGVWLIGPAHLARCYSSLLQEGFTAGWLGKRSTGPMPVMPPQWRDRMAIRLHGQGL